ncbi:MAG: multicopper oxidase domain-containing protein, partial [Bryobacteraceae bacterium]
AWMPGNTELVGVAQARDVEFVANNPGNWMFHCHLPHHMMNQMSSNAGPMSRAGEGIPAGVSMENGMGMLDGSPGAPLGDDYGPSQGRGMGVGSTNERTFSNVVLQHDHHVHGGTFMEGDIAKNANSVPGFPQDAFMEGPMMVNKEIEARPCNYGLRPGWSGYMQGMMTLVRALPPNEYDAVMERMAQANAGMRPAK